MKTDYMFYVVSKEGHAPITTEYKSGAYEAWNSLGRRNVSVVLHHVWRKGHCENGRWVENGEWHEDTCKVRTLRRRTTYSGSVTTYPFVFEKWEENIVEKPSVAYDELR